MSVYSEILNALAVEKEPMGPVAIWAVIGGTATTLALACFELEKLNLVRSEACGWKITNAGRLTLAREQGVMA